MASRALPPRKKKSRQPAPTTILALGDDLLRKVFLRLPSLPSLVRAALACPAFLRAVRSCPAFRRRFRELHSPTILGAFLVSDEPPMPTFAPIHLRRGRRSDPDHAAVLRGLDVFLTRLPDARGDKKDDVEDAEDEDEDAEDEDGDEEDGYGWSMSGCHDGYVLLVTPRWNTKKVAVYDPLAGALHLFPAPPDEVFSEEFDETQAEFHLISSEADDRSFRVLCIYKEDGGATYYGYGRKEKENGEARVAVFSPDTREWQISPTKGSLQDVGHGALVNGFVYWALQGRANIPVLNTATLQFSQIDLRPPMRGSFHSTQIYKAGETNDGKLCLVQAASFNLYIWVRRAGDDGVDKWVEDKTFRMVDAIDKLCLNIIDECPGMDVAAIIGGIVYLSIYQDEPPNWFLSFCLETRELKKLCRITRSEFYYPYIMAWPPSLVRNKVGAV